MQTKHTTNQHGHAWVAIVAVLAIIALVVFTWWSIERSRENSDKLLTPTHEKTKDKATEE